ncbi:hypothetical protein [Burkholderia sp. Ac-20344]|uniref:hypothetical protein n=1 Tax=Burkholderia sp. Ac-20344 TaxID=2703890 RepID=UPI00197BBE04|nr:hypothetical protein [Burkholderia sp. Ac-20344]MBN3834977.1 hypothetical protein [Burkholderia sp. Ac-20344]
MMLAGSATVPSEDGLPIDALLDADETSERIFIAARVALSQSGLDDRCPTYLSALLAALEDEPPYGTRAYAAAYRGASQNKQWLATSLITNAEREGDGATRLWSMAASAEEGEEQQLLKRHAVDESGHALFYLKLLDLTFPGAVSAAFRTELRQLSPGYSMAQSLFVVEGSPYGRPPSVDDFIQMNIAEIRTTIHHLLQRDALTVHCPPDTLVQVVKLLDTLLRDELSHVAYTGMLIERHAAHVAADKIHTLFRKRFRDFNDITLQELDKKVFD